ncbi:hypothetical protein [Halobacillus sp. Marseille-Q1614]|uniref:hypothetical protein n=1 Tax=Halobacillus sp. Marseille-Q1614 TaxID=2709134 RepID=UPI0015714B23|nr:hypothetical protein [Halobacillus sp. Marseille-Q1614]
MGITFMFMLLATITPFLFIQMNKLSLAIVQTIMLVGMWLYFLEATFNIAPGAFSYLWVFYYASLIVAEVAYIMFVIYMVKTPAPFSKAVKN